ncbi:uncharacterized protein LOC132725952 [Ruditapes philippinarum]|uniref:uncharacterized protein LOC132725952 n=1 Tax=Ruditapes philippinarum TaxID=129788 RepID=UPI00295AA9BB|nr:uncharacterized protein LOC132725952 [Ruditapes philippinarum]
MVGITEKWARLEKKIVKFREQHPESRVVCLVMIGNTYRFKGDELMERAFAQNDEVKELYKAAFAQGGHQLFGQQDTSEEPPTETLKDALSKHCFDMDMSEMRYIIGLTITPTGTSSGSIQVCFFFDNFLLVNLLFLVLLIIIDFSLAREKRRNFFADMQNCPVWWRRTSVPFVSLNHPKPHQRRPNICQVYELIESLQDHYDITPNPPSKRPRINFRFVREATVLLVDNFNSCVKKKIQLQATIVITVSGALNNNNKLGVTSRHSLEVFGGFPDEKAVSRFYSPLVAPPGVSTPASLSSRHSTFEPSSVLTSSEPHSALSPSAELPTSLATMGVINSSRSPSVHSTAVPPASETPSDPLSSDSATCGTPDSATSQLPSALSPASEPPSAPLTSDSAVSGVPSAESVQKNSLELLRILGAGDWNELLALSGEVTPYMPDPPSSLSKKWKVPQLLTTNAKYKDFIPDSLGKRICLSSTADGNCVFHTFSISIFGDESMSFLLRLMTVVLMADKVLEYSKYIVEEFGEKCQHFISSISSQEYCIPVDVSHGEMVEFVCQQELLLTARNPCRDCTLFHLHMLATILKRPVVNHYAKQNVRVPFMENIFPCFGEKLFPHPIHVVWVPSKPSRYATLRHVVPAICEPGPFGAHLEECAFEGLACCAFMSNANPDLDPIWIECSLCGQWTHDTCLQIQGADIKPEDLFFCGCDRLVDGNFIIERLL